MAVTPDSHATLQKKLDTRLGKIRWQQDLARRGQERKESVSPELAEALRNEIRTALDAGGKPFDVNTARRVYDLAIAARDMCVAATGTVKEAIDQIKDTNGPMETLQDPDAPEPAAQTAETFGARIFRELLALVPSLRSSGSGDDPRQLVHALAEARSHGMHDVAEELEVKLFGKALSGPRPVGPIVAVNLGSFDHGFSDGKLNHPPESDEPNYKAGYLRGTEARFLDPASKLLNDPALCEACQKYPRPTGTPCLACREIAHRHVPTPLPSGMESTANSDGNGSPQ